MDCADLYSEKPGLLNRREIFRRENSAVTATSPHHTTVLSHSVTQLHTAPVSVTDVMGFARDFTYACHHLTSHETITGMKS